jgi:hypothetical protein
VELAAGTYDPDLYISNQDARGTVSVTVTSASKGVGDGGRLEIDTTAVHYDEGRIPVTARDEYGNLVAGATVSVGASSEIGDSGATATTDAAGVAAVPFSETAAGTYALTVAAASGAVTETATVTVLPHSEGLSGGGGGTITATAAQVDGATSEITITAEDAAGNQVRGETIEIADDGGLDLAILPAVTTDDSGAATMQVSGTTPGTYTITLADASGSITDTASVRISANEQGVSGGDGGAVSAPPSVTSTADESITLAVTVTDENGVAVAGENITITDGGGSDALAGKTATTDSSGVATFVVDETTRGTYPITVEDDTGTYTSQTTVTVEAHSQGVASGGSLRANGQRNTDRGTGFAVRANDSFGNPVRGGRR